MINKYRPFLLALILVACALIYSTRERVATNFSTQESYVSGDKDLRFGITAKQQLTEQEKKLVDIFRLQISALQNLTPGSPEYNFCLNKLLEKNLEAAQESLNYLEPKDIRKDGRI